MERGLAGEPGIATLVLVGETGEVASNANSPETTTAAATSDQSFNGLAPGLAQSPPIERLKVNPSIDLRIAPEHARQAQCCRWWPDQLEDTDRLSVTIR